MTNLPGGSYDFRVRATDAGSQSPTAMRTFVIDATPPAITQRRPAANASITDRTPLISAVVKDMRTPTLAGTMTKAGIKMYVDSVSRPFTFNASTGKVSRQSTQLSRAVHTVRIVATDPYGNVRESLWSFTVRWP